MLAHVQPPSETELTLLREKLDKLKRQREVQRRARSRGRVFSVSLVGYTNAGKSTLFNALTGASVLAEDTLFATLDAVKSTPDIAKFQFRATNRWVSGTHNQSTIHGFHGAMQEMTHRQPFTFDADCPYRLGGTGRRCGCSCRDGAGCRGPRRSARHRDARRYHQPGRAATLRHAFITAALDAGVPLRDV